MRGDRGLEQPGLKLHADAEQFLEFDRREGGHHVALVQFGDDEPLSLEMADRLLQRDARHSKLGRKALLTQRRPFGELVVENATARLGRDLLG